MTEAPAIPSPLSPVAKPAPVDESIPFPPRYWWLKRIILGALSLPLLLVLVHLLWGWVANRLLQAEIDRIVASGEPIMLADFDEPAIQDDDNQAILWRRADQKAVVAGNAGSVVWELLHDKGDMASALPKLAGIVGSNAEALGLMEEAAARTDCQWYSGAEIVRLQAMVVAQQGRQVLMASILYHGAQGHTDECVKNLRESVVWADAMAHDSLWSTIGSMRLCESARAMEVVIGDLFTPQSGARHSAIATETRQRLDHIVQILLDDGDEEHLQLRNWCFFRSQSLAVMVDVLQGTTSLSSALSLAPAPPALDEKLELLLLRPAWTLDARRILREYDERIAWLRGKYWDRIPIEYTQPLQTKTDALWTMTHPWDDFREMGYPSWTRGIMAECRLAAAALALKWYETDHAAAPADLDALVPDYLPFVPVDPFDPTGGPIRYVPDDSCPRIYSVGENGLDDGGSAEEERDNVFFLDGPQP